MLRTLKNHPLAAFFILAFAFTWIGSLIYSFTLPGSGVALPAFLGIPGILLWYFGPCLAALTVTGISQGRAGLRQLLARLKIWRVGWQAVAFIFLYPLALHLGVVYLDRMLGGPAPVFFQAEGVAPGNPLLTLLGLVLYQVLVRGIGEETGWRAFAQPRLQSRWGALKGSLVLGVLWALWHFHPANFQALLSPAGIFIFINITLTAFIFTWVYNHTRGSLLYAALFHMVLNVAEYIVPMGIAQASLSRNLLQIALILITIGVLVLVSGKSLGMKRLLTSQELGEA